MAAWALVLSLQVRGDTVAAWALVLSLQVHCPKTFQINFMLPRTTPNRAYFKSLYMVKNCYFVLFINLCRIRSNIFCSLYNTKIIYIRHKFTHYFSMLCLVL